MGGDYSDHQGNQISRVGFSVKLSRNLAEIGGDELGIQGGGLWAGGPRTLTKVWSRRASGSVVPESCMEAVWGLGTV